MNRNQPKTVNAASRQTPKRSRKIFFFAVGVILAGLLAIIGILLSPLYDIPAEAQAMVQAALSKQKKIEQDIQAVYQSGAFSFADPLVIQDPYRSAPLTALLIFDTPDEAEISFSIAGLSEQARVNHTFEGYRKHHEIPIYGLYSGVVNQVALTLRQRDGIKTHNTIELRTEPLPLYLPALQVEKVDPSHYSPGFNFTYDYHKEVFDADGAVRWYTLEATWQVFTRLRNGRYMIVYPVEGLQNQIMMEKDLLGKIYAVYYLPDDIHHDIYEMPNGNLLVTLQDSKDDSDEDFIVEIDRGSGAVVRSIDLRKVLDPYRPAEIGAEPLDWFHLNSIFYDPTDSSIIISGKAQAAVVKLSYPEMKIKWILGTHENWNELYQPYLLTPIGNDFDWFWAQHHATLLEPRSVSGSLDLLLFDNGLYRSFTPSTAFSLGECYSRVVHYRINESEQTVEQVWEYGKERGSELLALLRGGAFQLGNGHILGTWSDITRGADGNLVPKLEPDGNVRTKIIEVDPQDSQVISEYTLMGVSYRTFRSDFYADYSESSLLSVVVNDTSANTFLERAHLYLEDVLHFIYPVISFIKRLG